ncbi:MAG: FadR family transcriptional regulator [Clostridia bacterium]|nr:FadR family transcriptional regulator [Clostridia bacterium]
MTEISKNEKLYIQAFREIRSYIMEHKLGPGDLLPTEQQLCAQLGVSRNVLREAIKSMELMGMVRACPGRGTELREFSLDFIFQNVLFFHMDGQDKHVREMFSIRKALELSFMRQAFDSITQEDIAEMRACANEIRQRWERGEMFEEADRRFHMTLFRSLNHSILNSVLDAIWAADTGFQLEAKMPHLASTVTKHERIVDALEQYDYLAFAQAMLAHYSSGKYTNTDSYEEF